MSRYQIFIVKKHTKYPSWAFLLWYYEFEVCLYVMLPPSLPTFPAMCTNFENSVSEITFPTFITQAWESISFFWLSYQLFSTRWYIYIHTPFNTVYLIRLKRHAYKSTWITHFSSSTILPMPTLPLIIVMQNITHTTHSHMSYTKNQFIFVWMWRRNNNKNYVPIDWKICT